MTLTDLMPFLNTFADNPADWFVWKAMADYFSDHGDDVGEEWALWVEEKRVFVIKSKIGDQYRWYFNENGSVLP
jgi:hypothetical protein